MTMSFSLQDKRLATTLVQRVTGAPVETLQLNALRGLLVLCSKSRVNPCANGYYAENAGKRMKDMFSDNFENISLFRCPKEQSKS